MESLEYETWRDKQNITKGCEKCVFFLYVGKWDELRWCKNLQTHIGDFKPEFCKK